MNPKGNLSITKSKEKYRQREEIFDNIINHLYWDHNKSFEEQQRERERVEFGYKEHNYALIKCDLNSALKYSEWPHQQQIQPL